METDDDTDTYREAFAALPRPATVCIRCGADCEPEALRNGEHGPVCEDCREDGGETDG